MGILKGALTVRRYKVVGEVPGDFRERYRDKLNEFAFREPVGEAGFAEVEGWTQIHNLLDTQFDDFNQWLYDPYAVFALRADKKTLPAKLFSATLQKRCEAWCEEQQQPRCPPTVKTKLKEELEEEWLKRTLPRVALTEACWNIQERYLVLHTTSEVVSDRFRTRFLRTFDLRLMPWSPLDLVGGEALDVLLASSPTRLEVQS